MPNGFGSKTLFKVTASKERVTIVIRLLENIIAKFTTAKMFILADDSHGIQSLFSRKIIFVADVLIPNSCGSVGRALDLGLEGC